MDQVPGRVFFMDQRGTPAFTLYKYYNVRAMGQYTPFVPYLAGILD